MATRSAFDHRLVTLLLLTLFRCADIVDSEHYLEGDIPSKEPWIFSKNHLIIQEGTIRMIIDDLLAKRRMTKYRLAVDAGIPHATLNDICSGKTKLERCSAETVYKLAKVLDVPMESLTESGILQTQREASL